MLKIIFIVIQYDSAFIPTFGSVPVLIYYGHWNYIFEILYLIVIFEALMHWRTGSVVMIKFHN